MGMMLNLAIVYGLSLVLYIYETYVVICMGLSLVIIHRLCYYRYIYSPPYSKKNMLITTASAMPTTHNAPAGPPAII